MFKPTPLALAPLLVLSALATEARAELPCALVMQEGAAAVAPVTAPEPTAHISLAGVLESAPARGAAPVRLGELHAELVVALAPDARQPTARGRAVAMLGDREGAALWLPRATADASCSRRDCAEVDVDLTLAGPLVGGLADGAPVTLSLALHLRHSARGWVVVDAPGTASGVVGVLESMTDGGNTDLKGEAADPALALVVRPELVLRFLESTSEGGLVDVRDTGAADPDLAREALWEVVVGFLETTSSGGLIDVRGSGAADPDLSREALWDAVVGFLESTTSGGMTDQWGTPADPAPSASPLWEVVVGFLETTSAGGMTD